MMFNLELMLCLCCIINISDCLTSIKSTRNTMHKMSMSSNEVTIPSTKSVGFIGLGLMGDGMARRLLSHGCPLTIWNRSKDKCDNLKIEFKDLVYIASSPGDVISRSDITFSMLSTPEVTKNAYIGEDGMLSAVTKGKSIIDCATLAPADMKWANDEVQKRGGVFAEGPVSGSKVPAEKGQLIFLLAGDELLIKDAQCYLDVMGKASHYIGAEVGSATKMKLIVNSILSNMLACLAEGISMTADSGLNTETLLEVLGQGAMASPLIAMKGPKILADDHAPNFPLKHALKDLRFAVDLAAEISSKAPMTTASEVLYRDALEAGKGDLDFSAVADMFCKS